MAFYARSEEARRSHSAHKLALVIYCISVLHDISFYHKITYFNTTLLVIFSNIQTYNLSMILQGALAMEDALSKGLPIRSEIEALQNYLEGIGKDSGLDLVLSSLPDETRNNGTDTLLHLNQKASYLCPFLFCFICWSLEVNYCFNYGSRKCHFMSISYLELLQHVLKLIECRSTHY